MHGLIAEHRGDAATALLWIERALTDDDKSAHAWASKGGCLNNLGRLEEGLSCCRRALELDATLWHAHLVLACIATKQGGPREEILDSLRRVLELWPEGRSELATEPDLAPLRADPRFRALVDEPPQ